MEKFTAFESWVAVLPTDNIDTDQIIPARFLKTISKAGLGDQLFFDWRYNADGSPKADFPLNQEPAKSAQVLLAGDNFGCGSSREHAPWALTQFGFRAVISTSFADIFKGNSLKNSLLPIAVSREVHAKLFSALQADPKAKVSVDLESQTLTLPDGSTCTFPVDAFSKTCLLEGVDELGFLLKHDAEIAVYEQAHAGGLNTLAVAL
ncbi:3-isopropylmalate dehydratase small subunit [uncultured Paludibaculum sp.]|uniref:3-isopropylmalate dehydratase small subunit n=1 Tax=uncultured Paludibaculum sp. TaxID=1765020 RepID=UPI002AAC0FA0|nr:3-isopropylmalate dehydratase small subunit [uncultured Paludibaculum sp.]